MQSTLEIRHPSTGSLIYSPQPEAVPVIQLDHVHKTYTMGDVAVHAGSRRVVAAPGAAVRPPQGSTPPTRGEEATPDEAYLDGRDPELFVRASVEDDSDKSDLRWTVDTAEDLDYVRRMYATLHLADLGFFPSRGWEGD